MNDVETIESASTFFFELPLYTPMRLPDDVRIVCNIFHLEYQVRRTSSILFSADLLEDTWDNYCPRCQKEATFKHLNAQRGKFYPNSFSEKREFYNLTLECTRNNHQIHYWVLLDNMVITKIGQLPSLADIANDEAAKYRKFMSAEDGHEFHKAIGLAAHGVGVGSFVYLRRIFENLVNARFTETSKELKLNEEDFKKLRMNEKIVHLKDYLPEFIVENSKIYAILSRGVHELDEKECLDAFEPIKQSIVIILEQDRRMQEQRELEVRLTQAIDSFEH